MIVQSLFDLPPVPLGRFSPFPARVNKMVFGLVVVRCCSEKRYLKNIAHRGSYSVGSRARLIRNCFALVGADRPNPFAGSNILARETISAGLA